MKSNRRRFLKTAWGTVVVVGTGLLGIPLGCRTTDDQGGEDSASDLNNLLDRWSEDDIAQLQDLTTEEIAQLPELTDEEASEFIEQLDAQAQELASDISDDTGKAKIPPGQHIVETIPVMNHNNNPRSLESWRFTVTGEVDNELEFTWEEFQKLTQTDLITDIHCVTTWTALNVPFGGVRPQTIFDLAGVKPSGKYVVFDCEHGYTTNIDIEELKKDNVLLATRLFGEPLPLDHGGPLRGMIPDRYFYKSGKWVTGIRILDHDEPGYWETKGYSNTADVWTEDRYS
jgi:DMSO/TMAO reductase YedYZ molybdopterin-dependent catalytic subunit